MANRRLVPAHNQQHNVPKLLSDGKHSLRALARAYFVTEVAEQTPTTIEAKRRDLGRFFLFYAKLYRHDRPEEWYASVTREFIRQTARAGVAEATLVRTYASVRHFARWIHFKVQAFPLGCPTDGVRPPREPEPQWKGLSRAARSCGSWRPRKRSGFARAVVTTRGCAITPPSPCCSALACAYRNCSTSTVSSTLAGDSRRCSPKAGETGVSIQLNSVPKRNHIA